MLLTIKRITKIVPGLCAWGLAQAREGIENDLGMRFVKIAAGTFTMGTAAVEAARTEFPEPKPDDVLDEIPTHKVRITQSFYQGETAVTQSVWFRAMEKSGYHLFCARLPFGRNTALVKLPVLMW